jgi:hypothetical protein
MFYFKKMLFYMIFSIKLFLDSYTIEPELIILFFFIPICMLSLGLQWKLTVKVAEIIRARDEFYTIPSANCSTELRPSLRLYLAAQKLKGFQKF